jgi:hypothetical protein
MLILSGEIDSGKNVPVEKQTGGDNKWFVDILEISHENYMVLCNRFTSRNPDEKYEELRNQLLDYLTKMTFYKITLTNSTNEEKEEMTTHANLIFDGWNKSDINYIGSLNIISLQIAVLFDKNILKNGCFVDGNIVKTNYNGEFIKNFENNSHLNYEETKKITITNKFFRFFYNPMNHEGIYLITVADYLTVSELNESFFRDVCYTNIITELKIVDDIKLPKTNEYKLFDACNFILHDVAHFWFYKDGIVKHNTQYNIDFIKKFYKYAISLNFKEKKNIFFIKLLFFIVIHESWQLFRHVFKNQSIISPDKILTEIKNREIDNSTTFARLLDKTDLFRLLPIILKNQIDENPTMKDKYLNEYLNENINMFLSIFKHYVDLHKQRYNETMYLVKIPDDEIINIDQIVYGSTLPTFYESVTHDKNVNSNPTTINNDSNPTTINNDSNPTTINNDSNPTTINNEIKSNHEIKQKPSIDETFFISETVTKDNIEKIENKIKEIKDYKKINAINFANDTPLTQYYKKLNRFLFMNKYIIGKPVINLYLGGKKSRKLKKQKKSKLTHRRRHRRHRTVKKKFPYKKPQH